MMKFGINFVQIIAKKLWKGCYIKKNDKSISPSSTFGFYPWSEKNFD